jgi:hypothetical protein
MNDPTVEYRPNPERIRAGEGKAYLGTYHVHYADGLQIAIPHMGWPGMVSADPLDLEDPEQLEILLGQAAEARTDYVIAELERGLE